MQALTEVLYMYIFDQSVEYQASIEVSVQVGVSVIIIEMLVLK